MLHRRFIASIIALVTLVMMASGQAPAPKPLTPEQNEKLKERDRLAKESNDLAPARKPSEAIVAAAKKLAIERDVLGNLHEDTLKSLSHVGVRIVEYLNADDQSDDAGEKLPFANRITRAVGEAIFVGKGNGIFDRHGADGTGE